MTDPRGATRRPFTVVCWDCETSSALGILAALATSVRRCEHGMLIRAEDRRRRPTARAGAMVLLQPCAADRRPIGPAHWVGPITKDDDLRVVRDWLEKGEWERPCRFC